MVVPWGGRSALGARLFVEVGIDRGVGLARLLGGTGLVLGDLAADSLTGVRADQEVGIVRNLVDALEDPTLVGVEAGARVTGAAMGPWGLAMLTSPTWADVFGLTYRYGGVTPAFSRIGLREHRGGLELLLGEEDLPDDVGPILIHRDMAAFISVLLFAGRPAHNVELITHYDEAVVAALIAVGRGTVNVRRGPGPHRFRVGLAASRERLPHADDAAQRRFVQECASWLDSLTANTVASAVSAQLSADPAVMPDMAAVAACLNIDARTLHRRLQDEGTTFRRVRDDVRYRISLHLLAELGLTVAEVAARVGYAEPTAFTHAFTRWHGNPPGSVRRHPAR